ncbi:protein kinase [Prosthecobacter sp. SYSU 5D2]|uniref:serine/threonine-protein kinase n=1 Tax=Prosthecobacter sp. SYSU 5D2 TaxID=3134134 RepID=UPI0031FEF7A9
MPETPPDELPPTVPETQGGSSFPSLEELGALLPQYLFQQVIGIGGMGAVYLAHQPHLDRFVALKVLPVEAAQNPEDAVRFNTEARAMARLSHPHIVAVFDFGQTSAGHLYLAMEYVEGADLHRRTLAGEVTPERARSVIAQLCEALQYAHEHGVIHRDIKPANILITPDWQVKVVDFGLARDMTQELNPDESEYGTPDYTAPERLIVGAPVDHRADIYSLGVVIHEILTGKTPLAAGATAGQGLPDGFAGVLSKCLMHDPARRFQKASEVRAALLSATASSKKKASDSAPKSPTKNRYPLSHRPLQPQGATRAHRSAWLGNTAWALACVVALSGLGYLVWRDHYQTAPGSSQLQVTTAATVAAATLQTPAAQPAISTETSANIPAPEPVNAQPPTMNKAIPTALALVAASATTALSVDYQSQVRPIFKAKCFECHSEEAGKEKGKVALDTEEKLKATIGPGQHIIPGEPQKSTMLILCKLPDNDEEVMPPKGKNRLTPAELTLLETWIKEGALLTGGSAAPAAPAMAPATAAAPTSWTSNDGKTIEAAFVALNGDQITLRLTNGTEYTFPLSRLSPESQTQAKTAAGQ